MKIILKDNYLLLEALRRTKSVSPDCLLFAESIESQIINRETFRLAQKYSVNRYELILIRTKPLSLFKLKSKTLKNLSEPDARRLILLKSILKGKSIYFSRLFMNGDCFEFTKPGQVAFEIKTPDCKKLKKINKHLQKNQSASDSGDLGDFGGKTRREISSHNARINAQTVNSLILSAKRDFEFIFHFNTEKFYQNLTAKGQTFTKEAVIKIYEDERYTKILDLSDARERMGFIALYAATFYGLTLNDVYSVGGIFSLDSGRETEQKKHLAGQDVFNLVFNENREEVQKKVFQMAETLRNLPLPEINMEINNLIRQNYTLYCGAGDIGRVFSRLTLSRDRNLEEMLQTARRLSFYGALESLYDEMLKSGEIRKKSEVYKQAKAFSNAAEGRKSAKELNFTVKNVQYLPLLNK
ncbi:MAG: hypothetical protein FWH08_04205 [Oscillospiraceae bacterium]|nr:hypothetical protein [Oscillospiraceae bacterium]